MTLASGIYRVRVKNERWALCDHCAKELSVLNVIVERLRRIGEGEHEDCLSCRRRDAARQSPPVEADKMH